MSDKIIPSYDKDGNLAGLFNVADVFDYQDRVHAAAVHAMGKDREEAMSSILSAVRGQERTSTQIIALVSAVVELADLLDASVSAVDAHGFNSRMRILNLYPVKCGDEA